MTDAHVELREIPVLRVKADMKGQGPPAAFDLLESKLPTLKGRRFYGTFRITPAGPEYYACVVRIDSDDAGKMNLETGTIPGGWYARRALSDWQGKIPQLPYIFQEMAQGQDVDPSRPSLEFYRSQAELQLFLPLRRHPVGQA